MRSLDIRERLRVEPLLLRVERSQLRWFRHLVRMSAGRLPGEAFRPCPSRRRPRGRLRTYWRDSISRLALNVLVSPGGRVGGRAEGGTFRFPCSGCCPQTQISGRNKMKRNETKSITDDQIIVQTDLHYNDVLLLIKMMHTALTPISK